MAEYKGLILIVDDEEAIRGVLARKLESDGYKCETAFDGKDALWKAFLQDYDLMLSDIKMPGMSGMEVLSQMSTDHPDTGVIMITAMSDIQMAVHSMRLGAYDYVTKPFNLDDLVLRVERGLERRKLILENRDYQQRLEQKVERQIGLAQQYYQEAIEALAREEMALEQLHTLQSSMQENGKAPGQTNGIGGSSSRIKEFAKKISQLIGGDIPDSVKNNESHTPEKDIIKEGPLHSTNDNMAQTNSETTTTKLPHTDILMKTPANNTTGNVNDEKDTPSLFSGNIELVTVQSEGMSTVLQMYERLKQDPRIKVQHMGGSVDTGISIKINIEKPLTLLQILKDLPEVECVTENPYSNITDKDNTNIKIISLNLVKKIQ